jgi:hypothetical protein
VSQALVCQVSAPFMSQCAESSEPMPKDCKLILLGYATSLSEDVPIMIHDSSSEVNAE